MTDPRKSVEQVLAHILRSVNGANDNTTDTKTEANTDIAPAQRIYFVAYVVSEKDGPRLANAVVGTGRRLDGEGFAQLLETIAEDEQVNSKAVFVISVNEL